MPPKKKNGWQLLRTIRAKEGPGSFKLKLELHMIPEEGANLLKPSKVDVDPTSSTSAWMRLRSDNGMKEKLRLEVEKRKVHRNRKLNPEEEKRLQEEEARVQKLGLSKEEQKQHEANKQQLEELGLAKVTYDAIAKFRRLTVKQDDPFHGMEEEAKPSPKEEESSSSSESNESSSHSSEDEIAKARKKKALQSLLAVKKEKSKTELFPGPVIKAKEPDGSRDTSPLKGGWLQLSIAGMDDKLEEEDPFGCELLPKRVSPGAEMDAYERAYGPPSLENIGRRLRSSTGFAEVRSSTGFADDASSSVASSPPDINFLEGSPKQRKPGKPPPKAPISYSGLRLEARAAAPKIESQPRFSSMARCFKDMAYVPYPQLERASPAEGSEAQRTPAIDKFGMNLKFGDGRSSRASGDGRSSRASVSQSLLKPPLPSDFASSSAGGSALPSRLVINGVVKSNSRNARG